MNVGFILTNSFSLAQTMRLRKDEIQLCIQNFVRSSALMIQWEVIDTSDPLYSQLEMSDWRMVERVLSDYYIGLGLDGLECLPLFIIGGEKDVPMPKVENPTYPVRPTGREYIYTDMMYCYDWSAQENTQLQKIVDSKPRFAVGRLPFSDEHNLSDLQGYLNDCIACFAEGITIHGAAMTTAEKWMTASREMIQDLHLVTLNPENVTLNNRMVVSPPLDTEEPDTYNRYVEELRKVDFMLCNLHGGSTPGFPSFYGEAASDSQFRPQAVHPNMLNTTCPIIFNTVACYGARYSGYSISDSMLYTAFRNGTMLYCGAGDNALGASSVSDAGSCSELMMKLYSIYLHKGMQAGEALAKAKIDYFRTCSEEDGHDYAMYTILEFNLFGCPVLRMHPQIDANYQPTLQGRPIVRNEHVPYRPIKSDLADETAFNTNDIHAYLRRRVDENLWYIRQKVEKEVYQRLGLGADRIQQVMRLSQDNREIGYRFVYLFSHFGTYLHMETYYIVNTNLQGNITKILQTK